MFFGVTTRAMMFTLQLVGEHCPGNLQVKMRAVRARRYLWWANLQRGSMRVIWYVALGGAVGSVIRYVVGVAVQSRSGLDFPAGPLLVNLTGSFLLGFLIHDALETPAITPELRGLLTTGFCGGYTTF